MPHDLSYSYRPGSLSRWRRLFCCFPDRAAAITREGKHTQFRAPYTRSVTTDQRGLTDTDNGDSSFIPSRFDESTKKPRSRKLKLFPSKPAHDSKTVNHSVASVHAHKVEIPIILDRFPQKPIPPSSQCTTECVSVSSLANTMVHHHRPALPNYVLNSLVRTTECPSSCPLGTPTANGHGVNDLDNRPNEPAAQTSLHQSIAKPHSSFTITFPKLPGFRRPPFEAAVPSGELTTRELSITISPSVSAEHHTIPTAYTADGTLPHPMMHEETNLGPRPLPLGTSWDNGDVEITVPSDVDQTDYQTMIDQNGGQGDSSSENLDTVSASFSIYNIYIYIYWIYRLRMLNCYAAQIGQFLRFMNNEVANFTSSVKMINTLIISSQLTTCFTTFRLLVRFDCASPNCCQFVNLLHWMLFFYLIHCKSGWFEWMVGCSYFRIG